MPASVVYSTTSLLARLAQKFRFQSQLTQRISDTLVPTINADEMLLDKHYHTVTDFFAVNDGVGWKKALTIPAGKSWKIYLIGCYRDTGSSTVSQIGISEPGGAGGRSLMGQSTASGIVVTPSAMAHLWFPSGWEFWVYCDVFDTNGLWHTDALFEEKVY